MRRETRNVIYVTSPHTAPLKRSLVLGLVNQAVLFDPGHHVTQLFTDHLDLIEDLFRHHLIISGQAGICVSALSAVLEQNLGSREAVGEILAGIGDVDSAAPSFELWDLGRMVAADPTLTALFDDPTPDRMGRLRDTAAPTFLAAFDAFLERHGARAPNE